MGFQEGEPQPSWFSIVDFKESFMDIYEADGVSWDKMAFRLPKTWWTRAPFLVRLFPWFSRKVCKSGDEANRDVNDIILEPRCFEGADTVSERLETPWCLSFWWSRSALPVASETFPSQRWPEIRRHSYQGAAIQTGYSFLVYLTPNSFLRLPYCVSEFQKNSLIKDLVAMFHCLHVWKS